MATPIKSDTTTEQILDRVVTLQEQVGAFGERLHVVEIDVAVIKSNYATRADVANLGIKMQESIGALEVKTQESIGALEVKMQESISALEVKTQESLSALEVKMQESLSALEVKTQGSIGALDVRTMASFRTQDDRIAQLDVRMAQMEARLIRWFVGTAITLSAVVGTIAFSAAKFIH
jgi:hypothetical protein